MFNMLANVSEVANSACWGFVANKIGFTFSATWLIGYPVIIFVGVLAIFSYKYFSLLRSISLKNRENAVGQ